MRRIKPNFWFFVTWIALIFASGLYKYFNKSPDGMHQGAQADRACVAYNYYHESMDFFRPRVSENRAAEGVAGMEFPAMNYSAALLYRLFGPHEFLYRGLMFLMVTLGVYSAFLITSFFIQRTLSRLVLVYAWFLSPIFLFYSNSFIPDPAALALTMAAIYQFFRIYFRIRIGQSTFLYLVFISLAGLLKVTFLIAHFSIVFIWLAGRYYPKYADGKLVISEIKWYLLLIPFIPAILWYMYAAKLTQSTGNVHFLQQINPAHSLRELADNIAFSWNTWQPSLYTYYTLLAILILFTLSFSRQRLAAPILSWMALLLFMGFMAVFVLFNVQFRYHDYYYFLLYPAVFFMLLFLQQIHLESRQFFGGLIPIVLLVGFYCMPIVQFNNSSQNLEARYTKGNYYHQIAFPEADFYTKDLRDKINKEIPENIEIVSAFDASPNTSLYLLRRRGVRIANDFNPQMAAGIIKSKNLQYILINDSLRWEQQYDTAMHMQKSLIFRQGILSFWKFSDGLKSTN